MGGNSRAIDRVTGQILVHNNRKAYAEALRLRNVDVDALKSSLVEVLLNIDIEFRLQHGGDIWPNVDERIFLGSAANLWSVPTSEFVQHKPELGDVDVAVPEQHLEALFQILCKNEGTRFAPGVTYVGQNRPTLRRPSINAVFDWHGHFLQVDFVAVPFEDGLPAAFASFAHSAPWEDASAGLKGVAHKYLLMSMTWAASHDDNVVILTDKSPLSPPNKVRLKTMHEPPRSASFSVDRGWRRRLQLQYGPGGWRHLQVDGKAAYKEISTSESEYVTDLTKIFIAVFNANPQPGDLKDFGSFQGLLRLGRRYMRDDVLFRALDQMVRYKLYGPGQELSRTSASVDMKVKDRMLDVVKSFVPTFSDYNNTYEGLKQRYYQNYREHEDT